MTTENKKPEPLKRANAATMRRCTVRLDELKLLPERYCHREEDELKETTLELFLDSLILEGGVKVPVVFTVDSQDAKVLIAGHRRVKGCQILADRNESGFSRDMEIPANELVEASRIDLLIESLSDNNNREILQPEPRLKAVKMLHDEGAEVKRSARALGVSDQTYQRELLIVRHGFLYQHVLDKSIASTVASKLIAAAEEFNRVKEFKEDLDEWIAAKKKELKDENQKRKAAQRKPMPEPEMLVKNHMPKHLVDRWIECIQTKCRFDSHAEWDYKAGIDKGLLHVSPVNKDLNKMSADEVVKILGGLSQAVKQLIPYAQERIQIEQQRGQRTENTAPYDFDILRANGMGHFAEQLEEKYQRKLQETKDGEDDPTHGQDEERTEKDLSESIELPQEQEHVQEESTEAQERPVEEPPAPKAAETPVEKQDKPVPKKSDGPAPKAKTKEKG